MKFGDSLPLPHNVTGFHADPIETGWTVNIHRDLNVCALAANLFIAPCTIRGIHDVGDETQKRLTGSVRP